MHRLISLTRLRFANLKPTGWLPMEYMRTFLRDLPNIPENRHTFQLVPSPFVCGILLLGLGHTARASERYLIRRLRYCSMEILLL